MATNKAPPPAATGKPPPPAKARSRVERARALGERGFERAQKLPYAHVALHSFEREQRSGAGLLAGGLAYRFFFWIVAFGLLTAAVASFWVRENQSNLEDAAKSFGLSGVAARSAASAVQDGSNARWYLLISGFLLMLYFGVGAVRAMRVAAFIAWEIKPTRMRQPLTASALFTSVVVAALGAELANSWVREHTGPIVGLIASCAAVAAFLGLGVLVFSLLPRPEGTNWLTMLPGAVLVAIGTGAIHFFTVYYLAGKLERSPKLYGTLGAATVVLLGLYLIARVVVSAMFLNATLHRRRMA
jgi:uncharacterized BrkB/YihY/UPF0761 family membrane protein